MKHKTKFGACWKYSLRAALLLVVIINTVFFFVFSKVGAGIGADMGTDGYKEIAESLVRGQGFIFSEGVRSTVMLGYMKREPVYPLFLSMILRLTGSLTPGMLFLFQTPLALISCYLIYRLGRKTFGAATGELACLIYAVHPISFWYSTRFASEIVTMPVMLLCLFLAEDFLDAPSGSKAARTGIGLAIATLTKSACVTLLPVILVFSSLKRRFRSSFKPERILTYMVVLFCCYATIHSTWVVRNYWLSGEIVPFTTMSGAMFFQGNNIVEQFDVKKQSAGGQPDIAANALYSSVQDEIAGKAPQTALPRLEAKTDRQLMSMARQLVREDPLFIVRKFLSGLYFIWFLSDNTVKSLGWMAFQMPLVALGLLGVYRQRTWSLARCFLFSVIVVYIVPYALLSSYARYGMPIIPIVILFSSDALVRLVKPSAVDIPDSLSHAEFSRGSITSL